MFACPAPLSVLKPLSMSFIMNEAKELLPGHVPRYKRIYMKLLPRCLTKYKLWKNYQHASTAAGQVAVGYSKFCDLWRQLCLFNVIMRQHQTSTGLDKRTTIRSASLPEIQSKEVHLKLAASKRDFYKSCCSEDQTTQIFDKVREKHIFKHLKFSFPVRDT